MVCASSRRKTTDQSSAVIVMVDTEHVGFPFDRPPVRSRRPDRYQISELGVPQEPVQILIVRIFDSGNSDLVGPRT